MSRITIKYRNGKGRCTCGGTVHYGATVSDKLPMGFGFVGGRFQIDSVKRTGFGGECDTCRAEIFAVQRQRHVVSYPKLRGGAR
jgi:hypothetical protein